MTNIETRITHIEIPIDSEVWMSTKHALREAGWKFYFQPNLFDCSHVSLFLERRTEDPEGKISHGFIVHDGLKHKMVGDYQETPEFVGKTVFEIVDHPAAKSSTSVLNASVCQSCGCKLDGQTLTKPCPCRCHVDGAR
jgi:hypothetical protein